MGLRSASCCELRQNAIERAKILEVQPGQRSGRPAKLLQQRGARPRAFRLRNRHTILTAHIIMSVGLLGDAAGFLAIALRAARTDDPAATLEQIKVLDMFSVVFGIPLSVGTLLTGLMLGLGTRWGVFRYPWVTAKLALIVSVMFVGGLVIDPAQTIMLEGSGDATPQLIAAGAYDVVALGVATALSVFKPGRRWHGDRTVAPPVANR